jgi:hypothetical protein
MFMHASICSHTRVFAFSRVSWHVCVRGCESGDVKRERSLHGFGLINIYGQWEGRRASEHDQLLLHHHEGWNGIMEENEVEVKRAGGRGGRR